MQPLVVIAEDDADIARLVEHALAGAGFGVRTYGTAHTVVSDVEHRYPALFLLDIMLPGSSGLELCAAIRRHPRLARVPVIFLTARGSESDRIAGLDLGADDYVTKPFSPRELIARVRAVLRRTQPLSSGSITAGPLHIDSEAMTITVRGKPILTTATEFRLLDFFARHPGRVFTRDRLLDSVWGDGAFVSPRSVDVYVRRLREKIELDAENPMILRTVRGAGYKFEGNT